MKLIDAAEARLKATGRSQQEIEGLMTYVNDEIEKAAAEGKTEIQLQGPNGEFDYGDQQRSPVDPSKERIGNAVIAELHKAGYVARSYLGALTPYENRASLYISWEDA